MNDAEFKEVATMHTTFDTTYTNQVDRELDAHVLCCDIKITVECDNETLQIFHLNRQAPGITHLLFADDSLLFFKGTIDQTLAIKIF